MINIWFISEDKENIAKTEENATNPENETDYKKEDENNDNAIHDSSSMFNDFGSAGGKEGRSSVNYVLF